MCMRRGRGKDYRHLGKGKKRQSTAVQNDARFNVFQWLWLKANHIVAIIPRFLALKVVFVFIFMVIGWRFAQLQVYTLGKDNTEASTTYKPDIIPARRGQIYIQNINKKEKDILITSSKLTSKIWFDASQLKKVIDTKKITIEEASESLASTINISYDKILEQLTNAVSVEKPSSYTVLKPNADSAETEMVLKLKAQANITPAERKNFTWLGADQEEKRTYPEGKLAASTIGYVRPAKATEAEARQANCSEVVDKNKERGTTINDEYYLGLYGLEQTYCSLLSGLNGKQIYTTDAELPENKEMAVQNGADIYTTLDINIQRQAEETLQRAVQENTNAQGSPRSGGILVLDVKTGAILATATYPTFDPNSYSDYNAAAYANSLINIPYEVGSVIKPLTVSTALNEWKNESTDSKGKKIGVPASWLFQDYPSTGKVYEEVNGATRVIRNAQGTSYEALGPQTLSNCLRDSINTCMADLTDAVTSRKLEEYYLQRFKLDKPTTIKFDGYSAGNAALMSKNHGCPFCFATHSFGQGFSITPLQLARAYTALANEGVIVEPYLISQIGYSDGRIDDGTSPDSIIKKNSSSEPVILPEVARLVTGYLVNTANQGYKGIGNGKGKVQGYTVAGKSGTAQISRAYKGQPCGYDCNTSKGLYDHTYIGFGPVSNPRILTLVTLSEPKPGQVENFSSDTVGPAFTEMMKFSLEYLGVPKEN
jgi:penicillin-binding protein 2B